MILLRVDASIRSEGSVSRAVADTAQQAWLAEHPDGQVVHRELGLTPLRIETWALAVSTQVVPAEQWSDEQKQAVALIQELREELLSADAFLFATPLYNFGVPSTIKVWIDLLLTQPDLGAGGPGPLKGRPAVLAIARGGGYAEGTPRAGWDHSTPYLQRIFGDVFQLDLRLVEAELTLAEVVPAMAELRGLAAESLSQAHTAAGEHGREIARQAAAAIV